MSFLVLDNPEPDQSGIKKPEPGVGDGNDKYTGELPVADSPQVINPYIPSYPGGSNGSNAKTDANGNIILIAAIAYLFYIYK